MEELPEKIKKYIDVIAFNKFNYNQGSRIDREDLTQEAYYHCLKAMKRFDPTKGIDISTYLRYRIVGSMTDLQRKLGTPFTYYRESTHRKYHRGKFVSLDAMTDHRGIRYDAVEDGRQPNEYWTISKIWLKKKIDYLIEKNILTKNEKLVIRLFLDYKNQREIGDILGVTESRISQILKAIQLKILRSMDKAIPVPRECDDENSTLIRIEKRLKKMKLTKTGLAKALQVSYSSMLSVIRGDRYSPEINGKIEAYFGEKFWNETG